MAQKDDLFDLIHALTQSEKRYFKQFSKLQVSQARYVELFDAINKLNAPDDKRLAKKLGMDDLSSRKVQLRHQILKAMRLYGSSANSVTEVRDLLESAAFLRDKGLLKQSLKNIRKAKSLAKKHQLDGVLHEILGMETWVSNQMGTPLSLEEREASRKARVHQLENLAREVRYKDLSDQLARLLRKEEAAPAGDLRLFLDKRLAEVGVTPPDEASSFLVRHYYAYIMGRYHDLLGELSQSHQFHLEAYAFWQENPLKVKEYAFMYPGVLSNTLYSCSRNSDWDNFGRILSEFSVIYNKYDPTFLLKYKTVLLMQLHFSLNQARFDDESGNLALIEKLLLDHGDSLSTAHYFSFVYNLMLVHFLSGNFRKALRFAHALSDSKVPDTFTDASRVARILEVVIFYELDQFELLESKIRSLIRQDKVPNIQFPYEKEFLKALQQLAFLPPSEKSSQKALFAEAENILSEQKEAPGKMIFQIWVESQLHGNPIREAAKAFILPEQGY